MHTLRDTYRMNLPLLAIVPCVVPPENAGRVYIDQMEDLREVYGALVTPGIRRAGIVDEAFVNATPFDSVRTVLVDDVLIDPWRSRSG